ncbi:pyruvate dehydrogenase [acetyl-transferring]-phosphatase 1, mitochondrial [Homalodisca vitripennis]|uniref:PPM-type phosphatase domain-containing protein n=1 Tax=Homalodisca liturata TaxID=320908 RepID=A0A1B6IRR2_9HEMI|nr:pyruvate dehydrogenase [acetyl-transferring]-phosphatase 1, mitochondrial [Homalodisca vitripennis]
MAARSAIKNLISNLCFEHHCVQTIKLQEQFRKLHNGVNQCSHYHSSSQLRAQPRLTPQEVTDILRQNEHTHEFSAGGSVKAYDSNQLPSNDPIEDTHAEARCLLTTGMLLGVFDGHGGAACAQVVAKRLFNYVSVSLLPPDLLYKYLQSMDNGDSHVQLLENFNDQYDLVDELKGLYSESFKRFVSDLWDSQRDDFQMRDALQKAFLKLDDDLSREALTNVTEKVNLKTLSVSMAGSVACVAHIDGPHLHVASVGDCQAVLGVLSDTDTWTAKKISIEHNTDNQVEVNRILDEHPHHERDTVIRMERLLGQLAPLRAFGDFRYKWSRQTLQNVVVPKFGEQVLAPNYHTPPYLTARPDIIHHRLTPRDRFLVIASDGLWDLVSPLQVVRLVGEHMSGKVTLSPLRLPRKDMKLDEINDLLLQRRKGLAKKPVDRNAATHLLRHALGGTEYGVEHTKISQLLSMSQEVVRLFRDDITIIVVFFDSEYLRHCPL